MNTRGIPSQLEAFVLDHIDSVHTLEVLLLMSRPPLRSWSAPEIEQEIKSSSIAVATSLARLLGSLLVKEIDRGMRAYEYIGPASDAPETPVHLLHVAYGERPAALIELIYSKPLREIRNFADAFRFKRKPE